MRILFVFFAALLSGCATMHTLEPVIEPPERYQQSRPVLVEFVLPETVTLRCAQRGVLLPSIACADREMITIANPCRYSDFYARLLCHELAHVNGWPAGHPE